jgi:hypothetical protein
MTIECPIGNTATALTNYVTKDVIKDNLVVFCASGAKSSSFTLPISSGTATTSTWKEAITTYNTYALGMWWAKVTGSGSLTVTTSGPTNIGCDLVEISGCDTYTPIGGSGSATENTNTPGINLLGRNKNYIQIGLVASIGNTTTSFSIWSNAPVEASQITHCHAVCYRILNDYVGDGPHIYCADTLDFDSIAVNFVGEHKVLYTDTFQATNGTKLEEYDDNWLPHYGKNSGSLKINSNGVYIDDAYEITYSYSVINAESNMSPGIDGNQFAQFEVTDIDSDIYVGFVLRNSLERYGGNEQICYYLCGNGTSWELGHIDGGGTKYAENSGSWTLSAGDTLRLEVGGNAYWTCKINEDVVFYLDYSASDDHGRPGIYMKSNKAGGSTSVRIQNFQFGDMDSEPLSGSVCWGHHTDVTEDNNVDFIVNWIGNGIIENNSTDSEIIGVTLGKPANSEIVKTGNMLVTLTQNKYASGNTATIKYRTAATQEAVLLLSWTTYTVPFVSSNWVQVRLEKA